MSPWSQVFSSLGVAASALIIALGTWAVSWVHQKVRENELANRAIAAQGVANSGTMTRVGTKVDGLHDILNGGQIPEILAKLDVLVEYARANRVAIEAQKAFCLINHATCCASKSPDPQRATDAT